MDNFYLEFGSKTIAESWAASLGLSTGKQMYSPKTGGVYIIDFQIITFRQEAFLFVWVIDGQAKVHCVDYSILSPYKD